MPNGGSLTTREWKPIINDYNEGEIFSQTTEAVFVIKIYKDDRRCYRKYSNGQPKITTKRSKQGWKVSEIHCFLLQNF